MWLQFFFPSLSHSETILTGLEITSWAWPGSPKMCWLRSLTSSCPTWGPGGLSHRPLHLLTHHRGNPSKLRYKESTGGKQGFGSSIPHTEYFHFSKAALHALLFWSKVVLVFRNACVSRESDTFQQEKPHESLLPLSSIPLSVWIFLVLYFLARKTGNSLESENQAVDQRMSWSSSKEGWWTTFTLEERMSLARTKVRARF